MKEVCEVCEGKGKIFEKCARCAGTGTEEVFYPDTGNTGVVECRKCNSTGKETKICERCNGKGNISLNDIARLMARMIRACG